jgi:flagellar hook-length control protein FliK
MNNISQKIEPKDPNLFNIIGVPDNGAKTSMNDPQVLSFGNILNDNMTGSSDTAAEIELQSLFGNTVENDLSIMSGTKPGKTIQDNQSLDSLMANLGIPVIVPDNNIPTQDVSDINSFANSLNPQVDNNQNVLNIVPQTDDFGTGLPEIALAADLSVAMPPAFKMAASDILLSSDMIDEVTLQSPAKGSSPNMTQIGAVNIIDRNNEVISIPRNFGFDTKKNDAVAEGIVDTTNNDTISSQKNSNLTAPNSQIFSPNTAVDNRQPLVAVVYPTTLIKNDKINTGGKDRQNLASLISSPATTQGSVSNSIESEPISIMGEKTSLKNNAQTKVATPAVVDSEIENNDATAIGNNVDKNNGLAKPSVSDDNNPALEESSVDLTKDIALGKAGMAKNTVTVLENNLKSDGSTGSDTAAPVKFVMPAEFNKAALKNGQTVVIKLKPESLGQIRLTLSSGPDSFVGRVVVENAAARTVIESNINQLYDQLARQGIRVDSFSVSMSGGQSGDRFAQSHSAENSRQQARWKKDYKSPAISGMSISSASRLQTYVSAYGVNCFA